MSGARSRRKGARWERELVHRFREAMPGAKVRRGLQCRGGDEVAVFLKSGDAVTGCANSDLPYP